MPKETCLKCGHVNPDAKGTDTEACPNCGAIYSRVKAAAAAGKLSRTTRTAESGFDHSAQSTHDAALRPLTPSPSRRNRKSRSAYVQSLREETNYPAFRAVVRLGLYFGYFMVAGALIGGIAGAIPDSGSPLFLLAGLGTAAFIYLLTRIWFELTVMVVDIADASVRTAQNTEERLRG